MRTPDPRHSSELLPTSVPLISLSRSPSPYARKHSSSNLPSEDEEDEYVHVAVGTPLVASDIGRGRRGADRRFRSDAVGGWLLHTGLGWQVFLSVLGILAFVSGTALVHVNRLILWTGVYKFPYPITITLIQLLTTHALFLLVAPLTRLAARPLTAVGLSILVAPARPLRSPPTTFSGSRYDKARTRLSRVCSRIVPGQGGIAGGGILEFDPQTALQVLPLAVLFFAKVLLTNLSFAYTQLPMYTLARIGIVPFSLILTARLGRVSHSVATLSSTLTATLNLLIATSRAGARVTWEGIVAGIFSSLFAALYPIVLARTHRKLVSGAMQQATLLAGFSPPIHPVDFSSSSPSSSSTSTHTGPSTSTTNSTIKEDTRASWQLFHYISLLSILLLLPVVLLSGEIGHMSRNCYFLDLPFFWFLSLASGALGAVVFLLTVSFTIGTSPVTATFLFVPRSAIQLLILSGFKMPVHSWVGVVLCLLSSAWFVLVRRREGRREGRMVG